MTEALIKGLYSTLLNDPDFDSLDLGLKNPNIFSILRVSQNEIRHSNFLGWLLNPMESHALGDIFLKRFLREVFSSEQFSDVSQIDVEGLNLSSVEILREWNNIDLLIITNEVVVCIENKVLSKDHSNQLERYRKVVEDVYRGKKHTYVYLNPEGEDPSEENEKYYPVSYQFICDSLERILLIYSDSLKGQVKQYISDYVGIIKQDIMGTDKLTELSQKIYANHKELFDFIIDRKPDSTAQIRDVINQQLLTSGYELISENSKFGIRWLTDSLKNTVYINKQVKGWSTGHSYSYELKISPKRNRIAFKVVIAPSDNEYNTERVSEILQEIKDFRPPYGKKWLVPYIKVFKVNFDTLQEQTAEEQAEYISKNILSKILPIVKQVDLKLNEHRIELKSLHPR